MSEHISHHYMPSAEANARFKGCLVLFGFFALVFGLVALVVWAFGS